MERAPTFAWWLAYTMPTVIFGAYAIRERHNIVIVVIFFVLIYLIGAGAVIGAARECNRRTDKYEKEIEKLKEGKRNAKL